MAKKSNKTGKSASRTSTSKDAVMLGGLYLLVFLSFQVLNFINSTVRYGDYIDITVLKTKCMAQFLAFLAAYFITIIYIKNRSN